MADIRADRLERLMVEQGLSQSALARRVGVKQPSIGRLLSGQTKSTAVLVELARELNTTPEYLTGESNDSAADIAPRAVPVEVSGSVDEYDEDDEIVEVPEIDLAFGMGGGSYLEIPVLKRRRKFTRGWLRMFTDAPPSRLFIARGIGDSMAPTIQNADIVVIDASENRVRLGDQIWAIAYGETGMIKRLMPIPSGGVKIKSDNPLVGDEMGYDGEVHVIGKVVAVVRKMAG